MWLKTILPLLLLTGCSSVVPSTLARMSDFSPLTVDPSMLQAAVTLPDGVKVPSGGATMQLAATRSDTNEAIGSVFILDQRDTRGMLVFEVAARDVATFKDLQNNILGWEEVAGDETSGSFSVDVALCKTGDGPAEDATFSVFVNTGESDTMLPIIRDAPVSDVLEKAKFASQKTCTEPPGTL